MRRTISSILLTLGVLALSSCGLEDEPARISGLQVLWHKITLDFSGPEASEDQDEPNPFLDYRLQVHFTAPDGSEVEVPGYFAGDGQGNGEGNTWRVHLSPDEPGFWKYRAEFRSGKEIAVNLDEAGEAFAFDGTEGTFEVLAADPGASGFVKWGRLEYVGGHYLKFRDGDYWIKAGADSPENFLAYEGFDNTSRSELNYDGLESVPALHRYQDHVEDWQPGDPDWNEGAGKGIIGALNYLASKQVNGIYFLVMNIGGDGKDVFPWIGTPEPSGSLQNDNLHYDISKLDQWETVFSHAQAKGIFLHFVFNEAEEPNKRELDDGRLGTERKLYYREFVARYGHHLAMQWNLCEEYNHTYELAPELLREFARYIQRLDPYNHPITVHSAGDPVTELAFTFGDPLFSTTSVQLNQRRIDQITERIREATTQAGRPLPASMDEFTVDLGENRSWIPIDDAELSRKQKLWPTLLSGGNIEFILEGFLEVESFKSPERSKLWDYMWYARRFMQVNLPFWEMEPADELVVGESTMTVGEGGGNSSEMGAQVFAKPGQVYAVYFPDSQYTGTIDLPNATGEFGLRWFNPRTGEFEGESRSLAAGVRIVVGPVPFEPTEDWVALIQLSEM